ncbi:hypothetical protein LX73_1986 [Fodinibius salinus]|uniref:Uncharacterized protein n=1 Tax=Fodinibius salinus TaxID=860790 RepID=A0A5D3YH29_9BACT|nr:hypothetical protein [Fodinibius salinus]TYP92624.1 hypothetical protein LX73_1986 [Fodinibius salinus]
MLEQYRIRIENRSREHQIINALLALTTGVLTLGYPNFLYLIAGAYLVGLGLLFVMYKVSPTVAAVPIVSGLVIFLFPGLIPTIFATFLGFFGLILLFGFQFALLGVLTLIIAVLIIANPDSVAYLVAVFLLFYSISNLIRYYQEWQNDDTIIF